MTHKIIRKENYLYVIDDLIITDRDWMHWDLKNGYRKIIAHLPLNNSPILEGVPLLPPFTRHQENDIDAFSRECNQLYKNWLVIGYKAGYNKAKEKYKYTEEDIYKAIQYGREVHYTNDQSFIQSLSQPKMPIAFECENEYTCCGRYYNCKGCDATAEMINLKPKTTTNPQGQTVWVGKYIY